MPTFSKNYKWEDNSVKKAFKMVEGKSMSEEAREVIVSMMRDFTRSLIMQTQQLKETSKRTRINTNDVLFATKLLLSDAPNLCMMANGNGIEMSNQAKECGKVRESEHFIRQSKMKKTIKDMQFSKCHIGKAAVAHLTGVVEEFIKEILTLAIYIAGNGGNTRVTAHHIRVAIGNDDELDKFFKDKMVIRQGGVMPSFEFNQSFKTTPRFAVSADQGDDYDNENSFVFGLNNLSIASPTSRVVSRKMKSEDYEDEEEDDYYDDDDDEFEHATEYCF
ncbi:hypothetical protein PPL_02394 [Heterostelium album PN500]|uniref:Uncharacterized protein n=1 Tax=Heterostelium pallidum (strain ATCC 26659 / Pp 5 / PN500) TaxID=670386 RepID=D3AZL2_HETP5|nr:hypothetical protein PPL_02394 [Heterostelium album PN500]EFA85391.1 hypothetical protein PPL_02394 [Heterostelium album PN500]|eukprot:XP_020437500.1 hypothetical protein PPL_02394 [Heterostelium album PN500]